MILNIQDTDNESFLRHWSERVYDQVQLAQIATIEAKLEEYAMNAWRPMTIPPPVNKTLLCAAEVGVELMTQNDSGEWRDSRGLPHKPPKAWMPCPRPPTNGREK